MSTIRFLKTRPSREFWLLAFTALLVLGAGLGLRDPWPSDEPRFALVAKQMVESGDWLFPHRGSELYSDKPPMLMWWQAAFYTLFGEWRIAFLLPSLLAALGTLWCVYDLGRRLWTRRVGLYAAWALLFVVHFTYQTKKAQIDPLVIFWITLANYGLLRHLLKGPDWRMWWLGWFAAGLGTITKGVGVLALVMIAPAVFAALAGWRGAHLHAKNWRFWCGPLLFAAAAALWLVPMVTMALSQNEPEYRAYLNDILFRQTAGRYAKSWDHAQPWWYHFGVMASMWWPALFALPWAIPAWRRRLRRRDARYLLPLAWWAFVVLFFSIPSGKRDVYILPALPMACLALGPLLPGIVRKLWARRIAFVVGLALAVVFFAAGAAMWFGEPKFETKFVMERGFTDGGRAAAGLLLAIGGWGLGVLAWHRVRSGVHGLIWMLAGTWVLFSVIGYPLLNDSTSARGLMTHVGQRIGPDAELGLVAWKEQNLLMADRPAKDFGFNVLWPDQMAAGMRWQAEAPAKRWLLVQEPALSQCVARARAEFAGFANRRRWWLVPAAAVPDPTCVPQGTKTQNEADGQED
ncbi:MAG: glycosyltransferase family 39 protein [Lysobacter sp.]|nr:MAG: glycosyltransferase family 39 protein [Lysobacter sp.]